MAYSTENHSLQISREINASTMVIRTQRSKFRQIADWVITLFAWCAFLYLLIRGIIAVGSGNIEGVDMPFMSRALPSIDTLGIYALAMIMQGMLLLLWAFYNWTRFHGKTRRSTANTLADERLMNDYGIDKMSLNSLRSRPVSVIHHTPEGAITAITSSRYFPQSQLSMPVG